MDTIQLELTKKEYVFLVNRYEKSLEKDASRGDAIDDEEFVLLTKLLGMKQL